MSPASAGSQSSPRSASPRRIDPRSQRHTASAPVERTSRFPPRLESKARHVARLGRRRATRAPSPSRGRRARPGSASWRRRASGRRRGRPPRPAGRRPRCGGCGARATRSARPRTGTPDPLPVSSLRPSGLNTTSALPATGRSAASVPLRASQTFTPVPFHVPVATHRPSGLRASRSTLGWPISSTGGRSPFRSRTSTRPLSSSTHRGQRPAVPGRGGAARWADPGLGPRGSGGPIRVSPSQAAEPASGTGRPVPLR